MDFVLDEAIPVLERTPAVLSSLLEELPEPWTRVDEGPDQSRVVRAKAWKKGESEPEKWTLEVAHRTGHQEGSPGLFGFSPQDMPVFIDNITVTAN